jgi:type IV secretory pathway TrbD component
MSVDVATADRVPAREHVPANEVLRDITRGGLAGLIAGILVAGVGGRIVMRLAALLVPESVGNLTENGNRIGDITAGGSIALIAFVGLFFGVAAGSLWVVLRPWLPPTTGLRALASIPIAVALGTRGLVDGANRDFVVLGGSPAVVASLVALVALFGPTIVLAEIWLDARLPHASRDDPGALGAYTIVTLLGVALMLLLVVPAYLGGDLRIAGIALVVIGVATLASWRARIVDRPLPGWVPLIAGLAIVVAVVAGASVALAEVSEAIGKA